MIEEKMEQRE
jgi:hypothetical protein